MPDFETIETKLTKEARSKSRVLVVMMHGEGLCLCCEPGLVLDYLHEGGGSASEDGFVLEDHGVDHAELPDGIYVGELSLIDDGPGDYPARETMALLQKRCQEALQHVESARPALKWVRNHAPRHDDHDQAHAQLALDHVLQAVDVLRGYSVVKE